MSMSRKIQRSTSRRARRPTTRLSSSRRAQTLAILKALPSPLHFTLVLTCAATALRASEMLALRWRDVLWNEGRIRISKRWAQGKDGATKTEASDGFVPLHPVLAAHLRSWRNQSSYAKDRDFVFPSIKVRGRVPLSASIFVADHLRPAAKKTGVHIEDGQRLPDIDYPFHDKIIVAPIAAASVWGTKRLTSAPCSPARPSASKKFTTISGLSALWITT